MKDKWLTQYDGKSDKQTEVLLCQKNTHPVFFLNISLMSEMIIDLYYVQKENAYRSSFFENFCFYILYASGWNLFWFCTIHNKKI